MTQGVNYACISSSEGSLLPVLHYTTFEMASLGIALQESLEPVFHIFSDNKDIWTQDTHYTYVTFLLWAQKFETARLYIELYEDNERVHEDCLLLYGDFPM